MGTFCAQPWGVRGACPLRPLEKRKGSLRLARAKPEQAEMCPQPIRAEGGRGFERSENEGDLQRRRASIASVSSLQIAVMGA